MKASVFLKLLLVAIAIAGVYGAIHDQLSCSVSREYFEKFKYHQFRVADWDAPLRIKAAAIGFMATWWMGIPIGLLVGGVGFIQPTPRLMFTRSCCAFVAVAVVALGFGLWGLASGWFFASADPADYPRWFIPATLEYPRAYLSVGHMHNHSYLGGIAGIFAGFALQLYLRFRRQR